MDFVSIIKKEFDRLTDANERHAQTLWYADNGR